jgi:transcriptional regulator with XRE-family HTH domain
MNNLRAIRKQLELTQQGVADLLGQSKASVSHYERGAYELPPDAARKLIAYAKGKGRVVTFNDIYEVPVDLLSGVEPVGEGDGEADGLSDGQRQAALALQQRAA